jgi:hypothetical protein
MLRKCRNRRRLRPAPPKGRPLRIRLLPVNAVSEARNLPNRPPALRRHRDNRGKLSLPPKQPLRLEARVAVAVPFNVTRQRPAATLRVN